MIEIINVENNLSNEEINLEMINSCKHDAEKSCAALETKGKKKHSSQTLILNECLNIVYGRFTQLKYIHKLIRGTFSEKVVHIKR